MVKDDGVPASGAGLPLTGGWQLQSGPDPQPGADLAAGPPPDSCGWGTRMPLGHVGGVPTRAHPCPHRFCLVRALSSPVICVSPGWPLVPMCPRPPVVWEGTELLACPPVGSPCPVRVHLELLRWQQPGDAGTSSCDQSVPTSRVLCPLLLWTSWEVAVVTSPMREWGILYFLGVILFASLLGI